MPDREFEVRRESAEQALQRLAEHLSAETPEDMGFALLLFDFGAGGAMFYVSNAERSTVVQAMQEFVRKQKGMGR